VSLCLFIILFLNIHRLMINKNINELIFLIFFQAIIINNANKNEWNVRCKGKKIIMIKKLL